jgi:hypothetical protein
VEELKKLEEVCEPDERQSHQAVFDEKINTFRPLTLRDIHSIAESIRLHHGVPADLRDHFKMARNLYVYSWFYYPFNVAAQLHASITVEFALKIKAGIDIYSSKRTPSFKTLLKRAVNEKWITDEGFSHIQSERLQAIGTSLTEGTEENELRTYCDALREVLRYFRNELAHGSNMLHNRGGAYMKICAELINQLFDAPQRNT